MYIRYNQMFAMAAGYATICMNLIIFFSLNLLLVHIQFSWNIYSVQLIRYIIFDLTMSEFRQPS